MTYTVFDASKPDGASQGGTAFGNSINANQKALRDAVMMGAMQGFAYSQANGNGSAAQPQYMYWTYVDNSNIVIRATNTWGAGGVTDGCLTGQTWAYSTTGSGGTFDTIATQGTTFDGSGNLTATTNAGGLLTWFLAKLAPIKKVVADVATHVALTGANAHGLGTISTQAANNVALTGGTINGVSLGASTPAVGTFTRASEQFNTYTPGSGAGVACDWAKGGSKITTSGTNAITFSNVPASVIGVHTIRVDKFNAVTWPGAVSWGASGAPSLGAVAAIVNLVTFDGGTSVAAVLVWNA